MKVPGITIPFIALLVGIGLLAVPADYEGWLLFKFNEGHAIRLVDALGLILAILGWFYLNWAGVKRLISIRRRALSREKRT